MKNYQVTVPITGIAFISVQAESEQEAIQKAMDNVTINEVESWEAHEHIVKGNVFYGVQNEVECELALGESDDDSGSDDE